MSDTKILVTGASGQLGKLVVAELATKVAKDQIAVLVRKDGDADTFAAEGYDVRRGDYNDVDAMTVAFAGIDRLLLISGSDIGQRVPQHTNVITAAQAAGVGYIAYTSLLRADENPMILAGEHKATEEVIKASGLSYTLLRNGWYSENSTAALPQILAMGQHFGAAGEGQFSSATRADYAPQLQLYWQPMVMRAKPMNSVVIRPLPMPISSPPSVRLPAKKSLMSICHKRPSPRP
jgi:NAD(P)H dehydrogenase (quinone)